LVGIGHKNYRLASLKVTRVATFIHIIGVGLLIDYVCML
jgi:hypothetical protein